MRFKSAAHIHWKGLAEPMQIGSLLSRHAKYRPNHLCLVFEDRRLTYKEFNTEVNRLANALLKAGLKKGEKFATVLPNCLELMTTYWAAAKTGLVIVPCSPLLQASGLTSLLQNSDTRLVIAGSSFAEILTEIKGSLPNLQEERCVLVGHDGPGFQTYEAFVAAASLNEPPDADVTGSDDYNIMYTSGTTGAPKGIVHTHFIRAMYCVLFANSWRMS